MYKNPCLEAYSNIQGWMLTVLIRLYLYCCYFNPKFFAYDKLFFDGFLNFFIYFNTPQTSNPKYKCR